MNTGRSIDDVWCQCVSAGTIPDATVNTATATPTPKTT